MNRKMVRYILGQVLKIEAVLLLVPCIAAIIYREKQGWWYLVVAGFSCLLGVWMTLRKPESTIFYLKEGCVTTALTWISMSLIGALPFFLTEEIPSYLDALFETVSGFTTTGASILSDVEALSHCALLWRSFTHWIGGMGVLVFLLAIVPLSGGSHINLMRAESPGPSVGKLVPRVKNTAKILYLIYFGMTILEVIFLVIGKMPLFDSICTAIGTAGTGGFGIKNDSMMSYSPYIQWVVTIFMILFGVNFNAYYFILLGKLKKAAIMEEVRWYFIIVVASTAIIFFNILGMCATAFEALTHSAFQVATIITTSGFATTDFNLWPSLSKSILVTLMFIGACAGSTGGGIKVSRILIGVKSMLKEMWTYIHPKGVREVKMDGRPVEHETVRAVSVYFVTFIMLFGLSVLLVSIEGKDVTTSFTAVTATMNNIGPGLEEVGPTGNFGSFTVLSKLVLIFDMLAGRLELFPMLLLFHPGVWRGTFSRKSKKIELK